MATLPTIIRWLKCFVVGHKPFGVRSSICTRCGCLAEDWRAFK
jgi:hypothetical protein